MLSIASTQLPPTFWRDIINHTISDLEKGNNFIINFKKHPHIFNPTIISLIRIAEKTGKYDESFLIIKNMLENNQKTSILIKKPYVIQLP